MHPWTIPGGHSLSLAYLVLNLDPILLRLGPIAVHWYGLAYVVAITIALWVTLRWARREGIHDDQSWGIFIWTAIGGLIGGRLYFVIQQPDLVQNYLLKPINIIAVWNGGMAFFGAIFLGTATLFYLAPRYGMSRFLAIDGGALFASVGQIFGRFGNIVNGDIVGQVTSTQPLAIPGNTCANAPCVAYVSDPHVMPWSIVYLNPHSFAPLGIPFQPAPVYEILFNLAALAILFPLRHRLPKIRAGLFFVLYLMLYAISQFIVFFYRGSEPFTPFLGINGLKQAQWTAIIVFLLSIPLFFYIQRVSRPWPYSAKNPVPWPPTAEMTTTLVPVGAASRGSVAVSSGNAPAPARTTRAKPAPPPPSDLPPWQPTRATGGRLRNLFGDAGRGN
ncbi:MAG TPA: prolipoprotein diacylglyceryl transferase [Ktedonobacterales bacterium]|nr:prolipoprotein diacylglyceryl transferase [Ktedonobacterales bacterium]